MAKALVTSIRGGGQGPEGLIAFVISVTYTDVDVPEDIQGQSYDVPVLVPTAFALADLRSAIDTATVDQATVLGITVVSITSVVFASGEPGVAPSVEAVTTAFLTAGGGIVITGDAFPTTPGGISKRAVEGLFIMGVDGTDYDMSFHTPSAAPWLSNLHATQHAQFYGDIAWSTRSALQSPSDGIITLLNSPQTGFTRLQFGGQTNSFPSIKRSGVNLEARLADDSGNTGFVADTLTAVEIGWAGRSSMKSSSDGLIALLNNAETGFSQLQFGGTSSSFPSLKRSGVNLEARLADDSGNTGFAAAGGTFSGLLTANAGLTVASGQTLTLTGVTVTGLTAEDVGAGTFPSGAFVFQGALAIGGALSGATGAFSGNVDVLTLSVAATQVVGARRTGWTNQTAVAARTDLGTSPTAANIAKAFRALYDDLKAHGLIGN